MFLDDFRQLARSIDNGNIEELTWIIDIVLQRLKSETNATIVDVWQKKAAQGGAILNNIIRLHDNVPAAQDLILTNDATGFLAFIAETKNSVWLDDINLPAGKGLNKIDGVEISGRYFNAYDRTKTFAGVPIEYADVFGILTVELTESRRLKSHHVRQMAGLAEPIGILLWKISVARVTRAQTAEAIQSFQDNAVGPQAHTYPYRTGFFARPFADRFIPVSKFILECFARQGVRLTEYRPGESGKIVGTDLMQQIRSSHFGVVDVTNRTRMF